MTTQDRRWLWIVLAVTLAYLSFELSFSSTLLDSVSSNASADTIRHIERWGRLISGFAAGLVLWSFITPRRVGSTTSAIILNLIMTIFVMMGVYHWEKSIVDNAQDHSSGSERKLAVYASLLRSGLVNGSAVLDGMPADSGAFDHGDGKAFIALSPMLTITQAKMKGSLDNVLRDMITRNIDASVGGAHGFYNGIFMSATHSMHHLWNRYNAVRDDYNESLKASSVIYSKSQREGYLKLKKEQYDASVGSLLGIKNTHINPSSIRSAEDFYRIPAVARIFAKEIGIKTNTIITPRTSEIRVEHDVWPQFRQQKVDNDLAAFRASDADFEDGGKYARRGRDAVALLTVPALALMLSVLFTLIHGSKVTYYAIRATNRSVGAGTALVVAVLLLITLAFLFDRSTTPITRSTLYAQLISAYRPKESNIWPGSSITWVIQAERQIYPIADMTRQHVLRGFDFDSDPFALIKVADAGPAAPKAVPAQHKDVKPEVVNLRD